MGQEDSRGIHKHTVDTQQVEEGSEERQVCVKPLITSLTQMSLSCDKSFEWRRYSSASLYLLLNTGSNMPPTDNHSSLSSTGAKSPFYS